MKTASDYTAIRSRVALQTTNRLLLLAILVAYVALIALIVIGGAA